MYSPLFANFIFQNFYSSRLFLGSGFSGGNLCSKSAWEIRCNGRDCRLFRKPCFAGHTSGAGFLLLEGCFRIALFTQPLHASLLPVMPVIDFNPVLPYLNHPVDAYQRSMPCCSTEKWSKQAEAMETCPG